MEGFSHANWYSRKLTGNYNGIIFILWMVLILRSILHTSLGHLFLREGGSGVSKYNPEV
jgi:hypothetical protein